MNIPLEAELLEHLAELDLPRQHLDLQSKIHIAGGHKRKMLMQQEQFLGVTKFTNNWFWNISPKYRFDLLASDISNIANGLATSLALALIYVPLIRDDEEALLITTAHRLAYYHLDAGFRLASSGWDRIALLLDLIFDLQLEKNATLKTVLKSLPDKQENLTSNSHFKWLKTFRDGRFNELDGKQSGIRHETTHRVSIFGRFHAEYVEQFGDNAQEPPHNSGKLHSLLLEHYHLYIQGVNEASALIEFAE